VVILQDTRSVSEQINKSSTADLLSRNDFPNYFKKLLICSLDINKLLSTNKYFGLDIIVVIRCVLIL
jgi:hypothetical protein